MHANVIAVISDLFFSTKVESTARAVEVNLRTVASSQGLRKALTSGAARLVLVDMDLAGDDALRAIEAARERESPPRIIAFYSHVRTDLAQRAKEAGADEVLPRSAFSARLPAILQAAD
jgi:CheY-like chemotaxis protein